MLTKLIKQELEHYRTLPHKARLLISAYNLRSVFQPILTLFINAFIWRTTTSIELVLIYNLGYFVALPIAFLINGKLLKKLNVTETHFVGLLIFILSIFLVIIFKTSSFIYLLIFGIIYGFGTGIYWSSRNYLDLQETDSKVRTYFFSIVSVTGYTIYFISSLLIGWIIDFSNTGKLYSTFEAYVGITIFASIFLLIGGFVLLKSEFKTPTIIKVWRPFISKSWNIVRSVNFSIGIYETTITLFTTLLILNFLGKEGVLGTIGAIVSIFTVLLQYLYGRFSKHSHHKKLFLFILLISVVLASILAFGNSNFTTLIYVLLAGLPMSFYWLIFKPWQLDIMDKELSQNQTEKYPLIVDTEIFLNIGRIVGVLIFLCLIRFLPGQMVLRIIPLILSILQILIFAVIWKKIVWKKYE